MSDCIPVDNDIRAAFIGWETDGEYWKTPNDRENAENEVGEVFDRWLNQVRAEVWDEGAEFMDSDHFWHDNGRGHNPYANRMEDGE